MKFITNKADILPVIKAVGTVCESKPVNAALSSLRLNVKGDKLQVMGSDGETTIAGIVPIMRDPMDADSTRIFLVEADIIRDAVSELPEGQILLRLDDAKPNTLQIEWAAGAGKATMPITDDKDFQTPVSLPKDAPVVMIPAGQLRDALNGTVYATANDDLRPSLSGVLFEIARELLIWSTPSISFRMSDGSFVISSRSDSMRLISRMSLIRFNRCPPAVLIFSRLSSTLA